MVNVVIEAALTLAVVGVSLTLVWLISVLEEIKGVMNDMRKTMRDAYESLDCIEDTMVSIDGRIYGVGCRMQCWIDKDDKDDEQNV